MSITGGIVTSVDTAALDALIARMERLPAVIAKYTDLIYEEARRLVHVKSGALRASIAKVLEDWAGEVTAGTGLDYAAKLEYGSARAAAYPYLRPAVERYAAGFLAEIAAIFT